MKKIILSILFLIAIVSSSFAALKYKQYMDKPKEENNVEEIEKQIKEVEVEIDKKKEEYIKTKEEKSETLKVVETWEEKIKAIRKYII